jgi:hypothetical protein
VAELAEAERQSGGGERGLDTLDGGRRGASFGQQVGVTVHDVEREGVGAGAEFEAQAGGRGRGAVLDGEQQGVAAAV